MNIADQIKSYAIISPDKTAIKTNKRNLNYQELDLSTNKVAHALLEQNKAKGCKLAIIMDNSIEFLQVFVGAAKAGWIVVPLDPKWSSREVELVLEECAPELIITEAAYLRKCKTSFQKFKVITIEIDRGEDTNTSYKTFDHWTSDFPDTSPLDAYHEDILLIGFTSGTTGKPKGYLRSHLTWFESFYSTNDEFNIGYHDKMIAPGPLVHSLSLYAAIHALFIGAEFYLMEKFGAGAFLDVLKTESNLVVYMVPTMAQAVIEEQKKQTRTICAPKAIISSGAKWSQESKREVTKYLFTTNIYEFYGSSEASFITVLNPEGNQSKPDSVGRAFRHVEISIRDKDGNEVKNDEIGKIFIKSNMIFSGYFKMPEESKRVMHGEWLETGDYAKRDEDNFIFIVGRAKNMIISGGLNIYPEEIEHVLNGLDEIDEAIIAGCPDRYWGEKPVAFIKWNTKQTLTLQEVKDYCGRYLASFKKPREIIHVDSFPYTSSGKIARQQLIDKYLVGEIYE
ncbi:AMP-binding protein [Bacillus vallismortis]|uniref:AMP-binding protein n=1 Tax=Bacillus vallismortis TaxID=72361 RepID=UPI0022823AC0|nr:AMP-binding protein [Bacillus vallismortis]MCI4137561.1 AMP-binding protein [Bacillus vallismortis]MCY7892829.1 AMP-binding protein [Bacillus vallismortis]